MSHTFDDTNGQPSSLATYKLAMQNDWLNVNWVSYAAGTKRLPCTDTQTSGYTGPLVGVIDPTTINQQNPQGSPFCNGTALANPDTWGGLTISQILQSANVYGGESFPDKYQTTTPTVGSNPGYTDIAGWREWHAEAVAIRFYIDEGSAHSSPYIAAWSQLVTNGWFVCTAGPASWAELEFTNGAVPSVNSLPVNCQKALPAGWVTVQ